MGRFSPSRSHQEGRQEASGSSHSTGSHRHRGPRHHTGKAHHSGTYHMTGGHHHTGAYHHTGTYVHHGRSYHSGSIHVSGSSPAVYATGSVLASGSVRGHEIHFVHGACDLAQTGLKWLPMGYGVAEGAAATFPVRFLCPASGSWKRTIIRTAAAGGDCTLKLFRSHDVIANPATYMSEVTVDMGIANHTYAFNPSGSAPFHEGDVIAFNFKPASNPGATNFTHIFELYTRIDIPS